MDILRISLAYTYFVVVKVLFWGYIWSADLKQYQICPTISSFGYNMVTSYADSSSFLELASFMIGFIMRKLLEFSI